MEALRYTTPDKCDASIASSASNALDDIHGAIISRRRGTGSSKMWNIETRNGDFIGTVSRDHVDSRWTFRIGAISIFSDPNRLALFAKLESLGALRNSDCDRAN